MFVKDVHNIIIWGNHSKSQYPDIAKAYVMKDGKKHSVADAVGDMGYLHGDFISTVQQRGAAVIEARGASSALSAANAALDHLRMVGYRYSTRSIYFYGYLFTRSLLLPKILYFPFH